MTVPGNTEASQTAIASPALESPPQGEPTTPDSALSSQPLDSPLDWNEVPGDVEMSLFDHLEELRLRIFYALGGAVAAIAGCFFAVKPIVRFLEGPAQGVRFIQLSPGEFFFVSLKVAAYSGLVLATPLMLYQLIQFVLPGLTRRERRFIGPIVIGSTFLFAAGLAFAYYALIPAALNFL